MTYARAKSIQSWCVGALVAICLAGVMWAGAAFAGVAGTAFENLATEVDARFAALTEQTPRKQRKALIVASTELQRVDRGLETDLTTARRIVRRLDRAYRDDAALGALFDGMLDRLTDEVGNLLFDVESQYPDGALVGGTGSPFARADRLLGRAQARMVKAAAAASPKRRADLLRGAVRAADAASREITRVLAPPPVTEPDPPIDPAATATGTTTMNVGTGPFATSAISAQYVARVANVAVNEFSLDSQWSSQPRYGVDLTWSTQSLMLLRTYTFGVDATGVLRRGTVLYDRNVSGDVQMTYVQTNPMTGNVAMRGTFRITGSNASGQRISATGTFDVASMPMSVVRE